MLVSFPLAGRGGGVVVVGDGGAGGAEDPIEREVGRAGGCGCDCGRGEVEFGFYRQAGAGRAGDCEELLRDGDESGVCADVGVGDAGHC